MPVSRGSSHFELNSTSIRFGNQVLMEKLVNFLLRFLFRTAATPALETLRFVAPPAAGTHRKKKSADSLRVLRLRAADYVSLKAHTRFVAQGHKMLQF